jgi:hypothetical protein
MISSIWFISVLSCQLDARLLLRGKWMAEGEKEEAFKREKGKGRKEKEKGKRNETNLLF